MSGPYNPGPGEQPGEQPQWGGYPGGTSQPQQEQPGYPGQEGNQQGGYQQGYPQQGGYPQGSYPQGDQPGGYQQGGYQQGNYPQQANYPQQPSGYGYQPGAPSWGGGYGTQQQQVASVGRHHRTHRGRSRRGAAHSRRNGAGLVQDPRRNGKFSDLHTDVKDAPGAAGLGLAKAYFGWLAWVLLALVVIAAVMASLPIGSSGLVFASSHQWWACWVWC